MTEDSKLIVHSTPSLSDDTFNSSKKLDEFVKTLDNVCKNELDIEKRLVQHRKQVCSVDSIEQREERSNNLNKNQSISIAKLKDESSNDSLCESSNEEESFNELSESNDEFKDELTVQDSSNASLTNEEQRNADNRQLKRGKCKWFNIQKGWGFITADGEDVFVHQVFTFFFY